jgi:hypothetical protein
MEAEDDVEACADAGFRSFVCKPVGYENLLAEVRTLVVGGAA